MVMALIAFPSRPDWVTALVYVTVAVTVLSGADYFFGLRRRLAESSRTRGAGAPGSEA
jgi:CDP-diacylglycerol--glycerol-3-phosphate 3-phosphatidyltransferase